MNLFLSPTVVVPEHVVFEYGSIEATKAVAAIYRKNRANLTSEQLLEMLTIEAEQRYQGRMEYSVNPIEL